MATASGSLFDNVLFDANAFGGNLAGLIGQTAAAIIYAALRKAGVTLGPQRTPSLAQQQDALDELNRLVDSFNCDRMFIFSIQILEFPLNAGQKVYKIGIDPSGAITDFQVTRPQRIAQANVHLMDTNPTMYLPLANLTDQQWAAIRVQDLANTIPQAIYMDRNWPVANLYIYGQPNRVMNLQLYVWQSVQTFFQTTDVLVLPPGYNDALVLNLACRLAPQFQRPVDPDLRQQARESMMRVESLNAPRPILDAGWGCHTGRINN